MATSRFDKDIVKAVPVLVVFFLLLKAYVVARYSLTTAGALVTAAPLTVVVGTIMSYLNVAVLVLAVASGAWLVRYVRDVRRKGSQAADPTSGEDIEPLAVIVLATCLLLLPVPSTTNFTGAFLRFVLYLGAVLIMVLGAWLIVRGSARRRSSGFLGHLASKTSWFIAVAAVLVVAPTLRTPWVPAEVLVLRDEIAIQDSHLQGGKLETTKYPVVFVLDENEEWTTVLDVESRILLRLPTSSVAHRQVCHYRGQPPGTVPLAAWLLGHRYQSPNGTCSTLVRKHAARLDPLVVSDEESR
ncbi:hypothetical protein GON03_05420 [Nocardioides sp. MAH-18]|uniref:Uncharacterized protein n=1 Tax=Nocardioides agri TaxID=2682843 RepID=A0A6L6XP56_9ACTN|nr:MULTISPECIES: hypothetical protein [unclassified Nocardioides]MBA2953748.1 hypothetical protein [Nocardioides sp. CGMCC 1.13656]MVQ48612.1 hypothetical protein [Nocardioides sp. MAH-18]